MGTSLGNLPPILPYKGYIVGIFGLYGYCQKIILLLPWIALNIAFRFLHMPADQWCFLPETWPASQSFSVARQLGRPVFVAAAVLVILAVGVVGLLFFLHPFGAPFCEGQDRCQLIPAMWKLHAISKGWLTSLTLLRRRADPERSIRSLVTSQPVSHKTCCHISLEPPEEHEVSIDPEDGDLTPALACHHVIVLRFTETLGVRYESKRESCWQSPAWLD